MYIPDDKFLLLGGQERNVPLSSSKTYLLDERGKLTFISDMLYGRQYFALCGDYLAELAYVIGGFNHEHGLLGSVETYSFKQRKWSLSEQSVNFPRINAAVTKCGNKYLYLFGGLDKNAFLDVIERFNV